MTQLLARIAGDSLAIGAIMLSGLPDKISQENQIAGALVTGHVFELADDLYNAVSGVAPPLILHWGGDMDYQGFENKALYFSAVSYAGSMLTLDEQFARTLNSVSPLPPNVTNYVVLGSMIVVADVLREYLKGVNSQVAQYLVRPLNLIGLYGSSA